MKKLLSVICVVLMLIFVAAPALAAGYTESVTTKSAPTVSDATDGSGSVAGKVVVTSLSGATSAGGTVETNLTAAESEIKAASDLTKLCSFTVPKGVTASSLVVSDLFDISMTSGSSINGSLTLSLATSKANEIVAVLHRTGDKTWVSVPFTVGSDQSSVTISGISSLSAFAVVRAPGLTTSGTSPQTNVEFPVLAVCSAAAFGVAAVLFFAIGRKKTKAEN